jgi:hypothetical protein
MFGRYSLWTELIDMGGSEGVVFAYAWIALINHDQRK